MNVRDDATAGNRGLDKTVKFLIASNCKLQVTRRDTLDLEIFTAVSRKLEHLRRQVFENGGRVHSGSGTNALLAADAVLEVAMNAADGKLQARP